MFGTCRDQQRALDPQNDVKDDNEVWVLEAKSRSSARAASALISERLSSSSCLILKASEFYPIYVFTSRV